jgi:hypothetical protein
VQQDVQLLVQGLKLVHQRRHQLLRAELMLVGLHVGVRGGVPEGLQQAAQQRKRFQTQHSKPEVGCRCTVLPHVTSDFLARLGCCLHCRLQRMSGASMTERRVVLRSVRHQALCGCENRCRHAGERRMRTGSSARARSYGSKRAQLLL